MFRARSTPHRRLESRLTRRSRQRRQQRQLFRPRRFVLEALEPRQMLSGTPPATSMSLHPLTDIPILHSNSSALVKLFLDFDGHVEPDKTTPVYDIDDDPTTFNDAELGFITTAWAKTSEDFAPFNVDVTTVEPPELADGVPESAANGIALRVAIGGDAAGNLLGSAYLNSFTNSDVNTVYVFSKNLANGIYIGDVASHEAGHSFGLLHQSTYDQNGVKTNEYNPGDGTWAPLMGLVNSPIPTTWHNGTSSAGPASYQDDMAVLAGSVNGFGYRNDDHGNTSAAATPLASAGGAWSGGGIIETNADIDVFSFEATTADTYRIALDVAEIGANLHAIVELRNAAGALLAAANPATGVGAAMAAVLAADTYYVWVTKTSEYGRVGAYTVDVSAPPAGITVSAPAPLVVPERGAATFALALDTQPSADVTIDLAVGGAPQLQATLSTSTLTFTPANWNIPQAVSVSGIDDGIVDGDVPFSIVLDAASADAEYAGLSFVDVAAVSTDHGYGGFLYWTDRSADLIQRSPLNGGAIETLVDFKALYGGADSQYFSRGLVVDPAEGKMYWTDQTAGRIQRANLDGSTVETLFSGFAGGALKGIEIDAAAGKMYWTNSVAQKIQRANLDGSGVQDLVTLQTGLWDVALDPAAGKMYWGNSEDDTIHRANLDGSGVELLWTGSASANPHAIAIDPLAGKMYWYDSSVQQILRANLNGTSVETAADLAGIAQSTVLWINVDPRANKLYWTDYYANAIYRSNLDGSDLTVIVSGLDNPEESAIVAPAVSVTPNTGLLTGESGATATFKVALTTPPVANVTIPVSSSNPLEGTVSAANLTFTPANWNVPQTVAVTGVDDAISDGDVAYTVVLGAATSADLDYAGVNPRDVSVTNADDEVKFYVVNDAATDITYRYAPHGAARGSSTLGAGNTAPRGVASTIAGDKTWVVDANRKVYVYRTSDGALLGSWTAGTLASKAAPEGIATNGADVWIVDSKSDMVFRYAGAATRLSGSQNAASSFSLNSGNTNPKDIVTDGQSLWVVNDAAKTDKVFKYSVAGSLLGSWTIDSVNKAPTGITLDPANVSHLWIVDSGTDRVYQYASAATRTSGSQSAATSFALAAGNSNPQGIADPPPAARGLASPPLRSATAADARVLSWAQSIDAALAQWTAETNPAVRFRRPLHRTPRG
jgi:sugar lactone lactonase YvrE